MRTYKSPNEELSQKLFLFTSQTVSIMTFVFGCLYIVYDMLAIGLAQWVISLSAFVAQYVFKRYNFSNWPIHGLLVITFLASIFRVYKMGGSSAPTFYTYTLIPVYAGAVLGMWAAINWTLLFVAVPFAFYFLEQSGIQFPQTVSEATLNEAKFYGIACANLICLGIVLYTKKVFFKYQQLLESERVLKGKLLRIVSHDIANPLTVISISNARLSDFATSYPEIQRYVDSNTRSINFVSQILHDVRSIERLNTSDLVLDLFKQPLTQAFNDVQFLFEERAKEKKIKINWPTQNHEVEAVFDQGALVLQVLSNLISNSIKFSQPESNIDIRIQSAAKEVCIQIVDYGVGMDESTLEKLKTDVGLMNSSPGTKGEPGSGFGIYIIQQYLKQMQGRLEVESKLNEGSTFKIYLPT